MTILTMLCMSVYDYVRLYVFDYVCLCMTMYYYLYDYVCLCMTMYDYVYDYVSQVCNNKEQKIIM